MCMVVCGCISVYTFLLALQAALRKFRPLFDRVLVERLLPETVRDGVY